MKAVKEVKLRYKTSRELLSKYGRRERDRAVQILHRVSDRIVEHARTSGFTSSWRISREFASSIEEGMGREEAIAEG